VLAVGEPPVSLAREERVPLRVRRNRAGRAARENRQHRFRLVGDQPQANRVVAGPELRARGERRECEPREPGEETRTLHTPRS
jgi:hypothetical protein